MTSCQEVITRGSFVTCLRSLLILSCRADMCNEEENGEREERLFFLSPPYFSPPTLAPSQSEPEIRGSLQHFCNNTCCTAQQQQL